MKKLLITGFDPFGGEPVNPAYEAVRLLPDVVAGIKLCKLEVPTEFVRSGAVLRDALAAERPDAVLCVGQAGGRAAITPERVAINLMDARIPDNAGFQPVDQPVVPGGPAAYFATLPVRRMAEAIEKPGFRPRSPTQPGPMSATACSIRCCIRPRWNTRGCLAASSTSRTRSSSCRGSPRVPLALPCSRSPGACPARSKPSQKHGPDP